MAEGLGDALVSRNSATTKHPICNQSPGPIVWHYLRDPTFSRFHAIPECNRHTHRQTDGQTDKALRRAVKTDHIALHTKYSYQAKSVG